MVLAVSLASCSRFGPVYPTRPDPTAGPPIADPEPSRIVAHLALTAASLRAALDDAAPRTGDGSFALLGSERGYTWDRGPLEVGFSQGRLVLDTKVHAKVSLPIKAIDVSLDLRVEAEPVVSSAYAVRLQSVDVRVTSSDARLGIAERIANVYENIQSSIAAHLKDFSYDLRPILKEAFERVSRPIELDVGGAVGCATLRVLDVEAGPTVLADGIEKDLALIVAPTVTLPCVDTIQDTASLPPLSNVAALTPGPFTVTIPVAARYDELTQAMSAAFTRGRLYFSNEYPDLYLEKPEIYESQTQLVLKLHLRGPVRKLGIDADLDGDVYLVGHPAVVDNELLFPDLEPTIETRNFLLSLKAMSDGDRIRDEARKALRLDIAQRLRDAKDKLGAGLTFRGGDGCFRGDVDRIEVTGVHPHAAYLRVNVAITARARAIMPCDQPLETPAPQ
jgi:hypothetical protein